MKNHNYNKILEAVNRGIQLALDDFDDEEPVQNIKSKQVQNRDYTKEYLDLMNEVVDLGLPSGTLWSTVNVGAQTPFQRGQYFSWGNIEGYVASYNEGDYSGEIVGYSFIQSNYELTDGYQLSGSIPVEKDAATDIMGGEWRIPTDTQFQELFIFYSHRFHGSGEV